MIHAETHPDDHAMEVEFDATPWFEQASPEEIVDLAECGWGGDLPADQVAEFFEESDEDVSAMFSYVHLRHKTSRDGFGFECYVDSGDALEWIKANRPELYDALEKLGLADEVHRLSELDSLIPNERA